MESGSGLECFRSASPRLQRALDEYGTSLSDSSIKIAEGIGPFSSNDTWTMTPEMFTSVSGGVQVIALAKTVVNATRSVPFAPAAQDLYQKILHNGLGWRLTVCLSPW